MATQYSRRSALFALALLSSVSILAAGPAGDLWQITSKMSMEGMPMEMPTQTLQVCAAKNTQEPPGAANDERGCQNSDMKKVGNTVTFTSTCKGPPAMTGTGEIIYAGTDSFTGTIQYAASHGKMIIKLTGHKVGGCDKPR